MNDEQNNIDNHRDNGSDQEHHEAPKESGKLFTYSSPISAAYLALLGVFLLYQFGGALLTLAIFGMDFEKADVNAVRLLTMGGQILFILLPALMLTKFVYADVSSALRMKIPKIKEVGIFLLGLFLLMPLLQSFLYLQNYLFTVLAENISVFNSIKNFVDEIDKLVESTYSNLITAKSFFEGSFIIFLVAVIPAVCEETFFRGFVQTSFNQKYKPFTSALVTGIFFGIYHFNPYGSIALIALGTYFGFAAYMSNSILIPISLHFTNNFLAVLAYFVLGDSELLSSSVVDKQHLIPQLIAFTVFLFIFFSFIYYVKKNYHKFLTD